MIGFYRSFPAFTGLYRVLVFSFLFEFSEYVSALALGIADTIDLDRIFTDFFLVLSSFTGFFEAVLKFIRWNEGRLGSVVPSSTRTLEAIQS